MANRTLNRPFCYQKMLTLLTGKLVIAADASLTSYAGLGFSAAKTATGQYTLTLDDQFNDIQSMHCDLVEASYSALNVKAKSNYSSVTTGKSGTIVISTLNGATPTDVSGACEIHFTIQAKNTSVPR